MFWWHSFSTFFFFYIFLSFQKSFTLILQALDMYNSSYPGKHWLSMPHGVHPINTTHFTLHHILNPCSCVRVLFSLRLQFDHCHDQLLRLVGGQVMNLFGSRSSRISAQPYKNVDRIEYIFHFLIFNANAFKIFKSVKYRSKTRPTPDSSEYIDCFFSTVGEAPRKRRNYVQRSKLQPHQWNGLLCSAQHWLHSCFRFAIISCLHSLHLEIHQPSKKYAGILYALRTWPIPFDCCFVHFEHLINEKRVHKRFGTRV